MFTHDDWMLGKYPFDTASCGRCMTMHRMDSLDRCLIHPEYIAAVEHRLMEVGFRRDYTTTRNLDRFAVTLLELRAEFDHFYPHSEPTVAEQQDISEEVLSNQKGEKHDN